MNNKDYNNLSPLKPFGFVAQFQTHQQVTRPVFILLLTQNYASKKRKKNTKLKVAADLSSPCLPCRSSAWKGCDGVFIVGPYC